MYLDVHLPPMFWRRLVGLRPRRRDLHDIDAPLVQRLVDIENFNLNEYGMPENEAKQFFEQQFEATFEATLGDGRTKVHMIPEGHNVGRWRWRSSRDGDGNQSGHGARDSNCDGDGDGDGDGIVIKGW